MAYNIKHTPRLLAIDQLLSKQKDSMSATLLGCAKLNFLIGLLSFPGILKNLTPRRSDQEKKCLKMTAKLDESLPWSHFPCTIWMLCVPMSTNSLKNFSGVGCNKIRKKSDFSGFSIQKN